MHYGEGFSQKTEKTLLRNSGDDRIALARFGLRANFDGGNVKANAWLEEAFKSALNGFFGFSMPTFPDHNFEHDLIAALLYETEIFDGGAIGQKNFIGSV